MNNVDKALVEDFEKIIGSSPLLIEAYKGLPPKQKQLVNEHFIELVWQIMFAGNTQSFDLPAREVGKTFKAFGSFILACRAGKRVQFLGPDFVAIDKKTWNSHA